MSKLKTHYKTNSSIHTAITTSLHFNLENTRNLNSQFRQMCMTHTQTRVMETHSNYRPISMTNKKR